MQEVQTCQHLHNLIYSPQLFDKVVSVLDPDTYVNGASEFPTPTAEDAEEDTENSTKPNKEEVYRTKQRMSDNEEPIQWKSDKWY